jgi:hypothetical protein
MRKLVTLFYCCEEDCCSESYCPEMPANLQPTAQENAIGILTGLENWNFKFCGNIYLTSAVIMRHAGSKIYFRWPDCYYHVNHYAMIRKSWYSACDRLCGLVVRVPGYRTEMYCVSCEVQTEFICYVEESRPPLWSSGQSPWLQNGDLLWFLWGTKWIYMLETASVV